MPCRSSEAREALVSTLCGSGRILLIAQNPPIGARESAILGELGSEASGGVGVPLSNGRYW
eukprot:2201083-Prymnesium_polylepis.1